MDGSSIETERLKGFLGLEMPCMLRVVMVRTGGAGGTGGKGKGEGEAGGETGADKGGEESVGLDGGTGGSGGRDDTVCQWWIK